MIAAVNEPSLIPISVAAFAIWLAVKVPHEGPVGFGFGAGAGVGVAVGGWLGDDVGGGGGVEGTAGVVGCECSITTTCGVGAVTAGGGLGVDRVFVEVVGVADADDLDVDGVGVPIVEGEGEGEGAVRAVELFGTTISGVVPGVVVAVNGPLPETVFALFGAIALEPMTTTLAVAAEVTPANKAAVTTVLVDVAASAEGR